MTEFARAEDGREAKVGDTVLIRARVVRSAAGVGVLVDMASKTDQYQQWVNEADLVAVVLTELPEEPADGSWLLGIDPARRKNSRVFHRDDAEGHDDQGARRHDRHWWDVVDEEWVDWPCAVQRGAYPHRFLAVQSEAAQGRP